jgi:three-Cys-motif partner protein
MSNSFFNEQNEQSWVKAAIVSKYFMTWAKIIIATQKNNEQRYGHKKGRIAYMDLFAGPGRYEEGADSTPVMILKRAINDEDIRQRLVTIFNDKDENHAQSLQKTISALPGIKNLKYEPQVMNQEVGTEIVNKFEEMNLVPTLFFVDPWGYKGLSLRLINSVLKDWGCDGIFFFNYNRVRMGIANPKVRLHMDALLGKERVDHLQMELKTINSTEEKESAVIEELAQALQDMGGKYVLPFRFKDSRGTRTSHHLIFVSKDPKGYEVMKDVMARESSSTTQGVPSFEYSPATNRQPLLFALSRPLDELGEMLLTEFAGQTLTRQQVYRQHNVGTPFIDRNYSEILLQLEKEEKITVTRRKGQHRNRIAKDVKVTFPPRG